MLKELINRARGQVWLRVTCPYPERVLNLCSARKLAFWDLEWEGAETFTCRMSRRDHRILSRTAEKLDCTIEIVRREGAPYTLAKLRHLFLSGFSEPRHLPTQQTERKIRLAKSLSTGPL